MTRVLGYFVSNVIVLLLLDYVLGDFSVSVVPAIVFVVFLTLVNWTIVPLIKLLALPFNILTLGILNTIINLIVIIFMVYWIEGITITGGFVTQFWYAILISIGFSVGHSIVNSITKN